MNRITMSMMGKSLANNLTDLGPVTSARSNRGITMQNVGKSLANNLTPGPVVTSATTQKEAERVRRPSQRRHDGACLDTKVGSGRQDRPHQALTDHESAQNRGSTVTMGALQVSHEGWG